MNSNPGQLKFYIIYFGYGGSIHKIKSFTSETEWLEAIDIAKEYCKLAGETAWYSYQTWREE